MHKYIILVHKDVDNTTLSEVLEAKLLNSDMMNFIQNLVNWDNHNDMQKNTSKTKEMIRSPLAHSNLPLLSTAAGTIDRVSSFKLVRVNIESTRCRSLHVNGIAKKPLKDSTS